MTGLRDSPPPRLETERLIITLLQPGHEAAVLEFLRRDAAHFLPWDPPVPADHLTLDRWTAACRSSLTEFSAGSAARFVVATRAAPSRIVAAANFSQFSRGPFQACFLGYKIASDCEGQGLMREALQGTIQYVFNELRMHRIHANYMPANIRSGRLLARLGFCIEGYARDYLFVNGAWRDHVLTSRTNAAFQPGWLAPSPPPPQV